MSFHAKALKDMANNSKTFKDLVALYKAAQKGGDQNVLRVAESSIATFAHAEAQLVSMAVHEAAVTAAIDRE
jgi:hypothetical protein